TSLTQTRDGYLWVAMPNHFARFDGVQFEAFTFTNIVPAYKGNAVRIDALLEDSKGALWLATVRGPVVCLKAGGAKFFTNNLPGYLVQTMVEDSEGAIWITYHGNAVCRIKDGSVKRFTEQDGLPPRFDCALAKDSEGRIWFAKDGQIGVFRNG